MNQILRYQFTIDDFERMGEAGIFSEDDRVELIDGEVRIMSPIGARHVFIVNWLTEQLVLQVSGRAIVSIQNPVVLNDHTQPLPDLSLWRTGGPYRQAVARPSDILLIIEVADSSLAYDRDEKLPRYAQEGVPEVWLVDVVGEIVTQYLRPEAAAYRDVHNFRRGEELTASAISGLQIRMDDLFGATFTEP